MSNAYATLIGSVTSTVVIVGVVLVGRAAWRRFMAWKEPRDKRAAKLHAQAYARDREEYEQMLKEDRAKRP